MSVGRTVPSITFHTRIRDESIEGKNPYRWQDVTTDHYFKDKRVLMFSLPGAFTPTCSTFQLPDFDAMYHRFRTKGIEEIYCISVNDAFVMNQWFKSQKVKNVKPIADGSGHFTRRMDMLVDKDNLGFGHRSWRYAAVVDDRVVEHWWEEPGKEDNCKDDPYMVTSPQKIYRALS